MTAEGTSPGATRHRALVERLVADVMAAHERAAEDRAALSRVEWQTVERDWSLLGEVEVRDGTLAGIAIGYSKRGSLDRLVAALPALRSCKLFVDPRIEDWVISDRGRHGAFLEYLRALEVLRSVLEQLAAVE